MIWYLFLIVALVSVIQMHLQLKETFSSCCKRCGSCGTCTCGAAPYFQWMPMMFTMPVPPKCPEPAPMATMPPAPPATTPFVTQPPVTTAKPTTTTAEPTSTTPRPTTPRPGTTTPNLRGGKGGGGASFRFQPDVPAVDTGKLDPNLQGTILAKIRADLFPLINHERACARVPRLNEDASLHSAAQSFAEELITSDLRPDYPHFSIGADTTVDDRVARTGWKGLTSSTGNLEQIIQYSRQLYDTNTPETFIKDIMCENPAVSQDTLATRRLLLSSNFNCIGIGYGLGNADTAKTNTKSCFVIVLGKDPKVVTQVDNPPTSTCVAWDLKQNCPPME